MSAPPSRNAIIKFAVSLVTCRHAETRSPFSGCSLMNRLRICCNTGICACAHSIFRLPASASPMSFTSPFFISAVATDLLLKFRMVLQTAYPEERARGKGTVAGPFQFARKLPRCNFCCCRGSKPCHFPQLICTVCFFPSETRAASAKMSIRSGSLVNGTPQIKRFDNGLWRQFEMLADKLGDLLFVDGCRAE